MTSNEFVIWLKGFTEGVHEFNVTPKQWDYLKEKLALVDDNNVSKLLVDYNMKGSTSTTYSYPINSTFTYTNETEEKIF